MDPIASKCKELHRYPELPEDLQSLVCSYHSDPERILATSRAARETVDAAFATWGYPQIQAAPQGSLISRLANREPIVDTGEGRTELVKRVRKAAIETLRQGELLDSDYEELGIDDVADLSLRGMNDAAERIQRNKEDRILVDAFTKCLVRYPLLIATINLPADPAALHESAERIRGWINDPAHQALRDVVQEIETHDLQGIPPELLQFPNLPLEKLLRCAIWNRQPDVLLAILNDPRPIDEMEIFRSFMSVIDRPKLRPELAAAFIRSTRELPGGPLAAALSEAIQADHWELIELILTGDRAIPPQELGSVLGNAVLKKKWDGARAILRSERPFSDVRKGLSIAIMNQQWEIAEEIYPQGIFIPEELGVALLYAFKAGKKIWVRRILAQNAPIDPLILGVLIRWAKDYSSLVDHLLRSDRPIDPHEMGKAIIQAIQRRDFVRARRLIESGREIAGEEYIGSILMALTAGQTHLVSEIYQLPWDQKSKLQLAAFSLLLAGGYLIDQLRKN